jgi:ABC-type multidrug transport system ATPase subunit
LPVVCIRSAVCLLDRFPALAGADLDVDEGEIVLLSGPNGAGKSTLLRLLAGLLALRSGSATVLGHDLATDRRSVRKVVALVGHQTFCYDDLTTVENARFAARAARRPAASADAAIERLELTRVAGVVHRRLSAGQQRRLAVAIAIARDPKLLLFDEPHAGLDAAGRELLDGVIAAAPAEGRTVVLASHELGRARAIAQREVRVIAGRAKPVPAATSLTAVPTHDEPALDQPKAALA